MLEIFLELSCIMAKNWHEVVKLSCVKTQKISKSWKSWLFKLTFDFLNLFMIKLDIFECIDELWYLKLNVDQKVKVWLLVLQLTFSPIRLILGHLSNWLGKNLIQSLKLGMGNLIGPTWSMEVTWGIGSPKIPVQTQTLISGHQCKEMSWADQP